MSEEISKSAEGDLADTVPSDERAPSIALNKIKTSGENFLAPELIILIDILARQVAREHTSLEESNGR